MNQAVQYIIKNSKAFINNQIKYIKEDDKLTMGKQQTEPTFNETQFVDKIMMREKLQNVIFKIDGQYSYWNN